MKTAKEWADKRWDQFENGVSLEQWIAVIQADVLHHAASVAHWQVAHGVNQGARNAGSDIVNRLEEQASQLEQKEGK